MAFKEKMIPLLIQGSGSYIWLIICFLIWLVLFVLRTHLQTFELTCIFFVSFPGSIAVCGFEDLSAQKGNASPRE